MRLLFADQLGPHFTDDAQQVLLVESRAVFERRVYHRAKAHLVLSALRHRAAELGERAVLLQRRTYGAALREVGPDECVHPTSRRALDLVSRWGLSVLPARGFVTPMAEFGRWADGRRRLVMEDFYRDYRRRSGVLMDGDRPVGGEWNYDAENREPPPKGESRLPVPDPWWPQEDDIDAEVRAELDQWEAEGVRFSGVDGPRRFPVTRSEALAALDHFVRLRLPTFGRFEDAMLAADDWMSHSLLSVPLNLGLLDPVEVIEAVVAAYRAGVAPLAAVEGFVRQVAGWREWMWQLYWWFPADYAQRNELHHTVPVPPWLDALAGDEVRARCLSVVLDRTRRLGWAHHIERLMVLGSWGLQRGYDPQQLTDWFQRNFVDGYEWVMVGNVVGMSQYADGGMLATKPYTSGGAYLNRMSDFCGSCDYRPDRRVGPDACPFTAGYWTFLERAAPALKGNRRMAQPLAGLRRLSDLPAVLAQEQERGIP